MPKFQEISSQKTWEEPKKPWTKVETYNKSVVYNGRLYHLTKYTRSPNYLQRLWCALEVLWLLIKSLGKAYNTREFCSRWDKARGVKNISIRFLGQDHFEPFSVTLKQLIEQPALYQNAWKKLENLTKIVMRELLGQPGYSFNLAKRNAKANRYPDVLPYDKNVVTTADGKYVNCSKVEMNGIVRLLTQGPIGPEERDDTGTVEEFLTLAWEQNAKIVCLTNRIELFKVKCHPYWLAGYSQEFSNGLKCLGEKNSTVIAEFNDQRLVRRELKVVDKEGKELRPIIMLHYENWRDFTPPNFNLLKSLHDEIKPQDSCLLHCSAGVGRTGTFVAVEMICQEMERQLQAGVPLDEVKVNIPSTIFELRKQRLGIVQTPEQFQAIVTYTMLYYQTKRVASK